MSSLYLTQVTFEDLPWFTSFINRQTLKTEDRSRIWVQTECKGYGHTKKQCDRHTKNVKRISKLEFDKDIINKLMEIFNVNKKEIDQVKKENN